MVGGIPIYVASASTIIHSVLVHLDTGWQMSIQSNKGTLGSSVSTQVGMVTDCPFSLPSVSVVGSKSVMAGTEQHPILLPLPGNVQMHPSPE